VIVKWKLPSYLRQDQVRLFFSVITSPRDKALFTTIYLYGLRVSEARLLQREDIDLDRRTIRIWRVKNGYSGEKPLFGSWYWYRFSSATSGPGPMTMRRSSSVAKGA
jgi:integrase